MGIDICVRISYNGWVDGILDKTHILDSLVRSQWYWNACVTKVLSRHKRRLRLVLLCKDCKAQLLKSTLELQDQVKETLSWLSEKEDPLDAKEFGRRLELVQTHLDLESLPFSTC